MKDTKPHSDTFLRFGRSAHRSARWAGRLILGTAFGLWALVGLHLLTFDAGRPLTRESVERQRHRRETLKTCLLESSPQRRPYCELRSSAMVTGPTSPRQLAVRILLTALLALCAAVALLTASINVFLCRAVARGRPWAARLATGLAGAGWLSMAMLFYVGVLPEATSTALLFQTLTVLTLAVSSIQAHRRNATHAQKKPAPSSSKAPTGEPALSPLS